MSTILLKYVLYVLRLNINNVCVAACIRWLSAYGMLTMVLRLCTKKRRWLYSDCLYCINWVGSAFVSQSVDKLLRSRPYCHQLRLDVRYAHVCKRSARFILSCLKSKSKVFRSVASLSVLFGRHWEQFCFFLLFTVQLELFWIFLSTVDTRNKVLYNNYLHDADDSERCSATLLAELISVRDGLSDISFYCATQTDMHSA